MPPPASSSPSQALTGWRPSLPAGAKPGPSPAWRVTLFLVITTLIIAAIGGYTFQRLGDQIRADTHRTLRVIAEQKRQQIEQLVAQSRSDAETFFIGASVIEQLFEAWAEDDRRDIGFLDKMRARMERVVEARGWGGLAVLDQSGNHLFSVTPTDLGHHQALIQNLLEDPRIEFVDLHQNPDGVAEFGVMVPIGLPGKQPLGLAYLHWLAAETLYPLVDAWPVPTETAETFLFRREGDEVVNLTPLRHRDHALPPLRLSLDSQVPAAWAARGHLGIIEGFEDYRGLPVLAYATAIAGTSWLMLAKIDEGEANAGLRDLAWFTALAMGFAMLLLHGSGYLLWRRDRQRQALAALQREQAIQAEKLNTLRLLDAIANGSSDAIFAKELQGRYLFMNQAAARLAGKEVAEMLGRDDTALFPAEQAAVVMANDQQVIRENRIVTAQNTLAMVGGERVMLATKGPLHDAQGQVTGLFGISRDITELLEAEKQLREARETAARHASEQRLGALIQQGLAGVAETDLEGRLVRFNDRFCAILGHPREVLEGRMLLDFLPPEDASKEIALRQQLLEGLPPPVIEGRYRRQDGTLAYAQVSLSLIRDDADRPQGLLGVGIDITALKSSEQALRDSEQRYRELNAELERRVAARTAEARAASAAKSEFLAHMSHEIRTPLNVIHGLSQVLQREDLDEDHLALVSRIQEAGQTLLALINDILDLSKIEAGQLRIEPRPFALGKLLDKLVNLLGHAARAKGLALRCEAASTPWQLLRGDALRLEQVLLNLVGNAIKFTERGAVSLGVKTLDSADPQRMRLRFSVQDTGIGIAPAALQTLFTPFTQADAEISRRFGGTGLGLAISKRLVELMGGQIGAESQPGQGSTFWFEVPLERGDLDVQPAQDLPALPVAGPKLTGLHLLVVDDSAMNRDLMERVLRMEGARASLAADGQQAVQTLALQPQAFDGVLMDIRMPVMDGLKATRLIRQELGLSQLPIIALTAGVLAEEQAAAREAGCDAILPKPLDIGRMTAILTERIQSRALADSRPPASSRPPATVKPQGAVAPPASPVTRPAECDPGTWPDIPGIDTEQVTQLLNGHRDFFLELLASFLSGTVGLEEGLREDLAQGRRRDATHRLHHLAGNAGAIGALDLMASAKALERDIDQGETALDDRLANLGQQLAHLAAASAPWLPASSPALPSPGDPKLARSLDPAQLRALREALRGHRLKALEMFDDLKAPLTAACGSSVIQGLEAALRGLRYGEALEILATLPPPAP